MNSVATAAGAVAAVPRRRASCCCRAGCSAPTTPAPRRSSSWSRCRWRWRCGCRCGSRRTCSDPTTPPAPCTARCSTRWPPAGCTACAPCSRVPTVAATLAGLAAHRMVFGINTLLVLVIVRHTDTATTVAGLGHRGAVRGGRRHRFVPRQRPHPRRSCAAGAATRPPTAPWLRGASCSSAAVGLQLPVMIVCGFLLGRGRPGGQAVRRHRDAARRRRRPARARLHGPGLAVLGVVHRRDRRRPPRSSPPTVTPRRSWSPASVLYLVGLAVHAVARPARRRRPD